MEWSEIIIGVLSIISLLLGGKLVLLRNVVKEVSEIFPALDDVLDETNDESKLEKLKDLKYLRLQCTEAVEAMKKLFKGGKNEK